jgi:hypothetical protein
MKSGQGFKLDAGNHGSAAQESDRYLKARTSKGGKTMSGSKPGKVIITCADHRRDPYADDVGRVALSPRNRSPKARSRPRRRGQRSCICTPAIRKTAAPPATPRCSTNSCRVIKQATDAVVNITTGGSLTMSVESRLHHRGAGIARDVFAQHGHDEFRAASAGRSLQDLEIRLGREIICANRTITSSATLSATSR